MGTVNCLERYTEEFDLCKIPDSVIIEELKKELKQKEFELGQANSYIQELEDGKIEKIYLNENECEKCKERKTHLSNLNLKQIELKKKLSEFESLPLGELEESRKIKDNYYKLIEENKRLQAQLIKQAKEIQELKRVTL